MNNLFKTLALCMALLLVTLALTSCFSDKPPKGKPEDADLTPLPVPTGEPEQPESEKPEPTSETNAQQTDYRRSTLYYLTDEDYILPVTVDIPWETGIAKACLAKLVANPENRMETQQKGLKTVIPEGTVI